MEKSRARDNLDPYPGPDGLDTELGVLARSAGVSTVVYGRSRQDRPLTAYRVGTGDARPAVLCCANIHGPEWIGTRVCVGLFEALVGKRTCPDIETLRARANVWLVPRVNPDGYARTHALRGMGPLAPMRTNAAGVDLNRNWPLPAGAARSRLPGAGSHKPGSATFIGAGPLSEPETAGLDELVSEVRPHASADLHSFMGTLFPARCPAPRGFDAYRRLCTAFRQGQEHTPYLRVASRHFDAWTGEQEDHLHHNRDCWAVCVECFPLSASYRQHLRPPSTFWRFNPHDPRPWVKNDVPGVVSYFLAALDLPRPSALERTND